MVPSSGFPAQEIAVLALHHQHLVLVVDGHAQYYDTGGAAGHERGDHEHGVERIPCVHGFEEARGLLEEGDERIADHVREDAGARRAWAATRRPWARRSRWPRARQYGRS